MVKRLKAADEETLEHVARYRLTTPVILARRQHGDTEAARVELDRLTADRYLAASELTPGHVSVVCYQLTPKAAVALGHDAAFARPLGRDARIECFAAASFCCCGEAFRQLYTKNEFTTKYRTLWRPGQPVSYYLEPAEAGRAKLAFLKVDGHGLGRWDRLIDSCARFLRQRTDVRVEAAFRPQADAYAEMVRRGRFQFSVLTALDDKRRAIELELDRRRAAGEPTPPIRAYVVAGLRDVMFPPPSAVTPSAPLA